MSYLAAALKIIYSGISESQAEQFLYFLSLGTEFKDLTLQVIKQRVLEASCIPMSVKKIMRCPQCKRWKLTNRVFCEECSKNLTVNVLIPLLEEALS